MINVTADEEVCDLFLAFARFSIYQRLCSDIVTIGIVFAVWLSGTTRLSRVYLSRCSPFWGCLIKAFYFRNLAGLFSGYILMFYCMNQVYACLYGSS